jgi:hypothetical protein
MTRRNTDPTGKLVEVQFLDPAAYGSWIPKEALPSLTPATCISYGVCMEWTDEVVKVAGGSNSVGQVGNVDVIPRTLVTSVRFLEYK